MSIKTTKITKDKTKISNILKTIKINTRIRIIATKITTIRIMPIKIMVIKIMPRTTTIRTPNRIKIIKISNGKSNKRNGIKRDNIKENYKTHYRKVKASSVNSKNIE